MSTFAVAIRVGRDLFLWIRLRRAPTGDLYYVLPTGRSGRAWKHWNPHGSLHRNGTLHHKTYDNKLHVTTVNRPDANFKGTVHLVSRGAAPDEPSGFGVICDPAQFDEVMEVPVDRLSPNKYETCFYLDLTDTAGLPSINTATGGTICSRHIFKDVVPWVVVTLAFQSLPAGMTRIPFP